MICLLAVILMLVGAAASAIVVIAMWDAGVAGLAPMATATTGKLRPPSVGGLFHILGHAYDVARWHV
jgi:hypothetical protein